MSWLEELNQQRNVDERITELSRVQSNAIALISSNRRITFSELEEQTNQIAAGLADRGVGPGDVIAVCLNNCCEIVPTLRGIIRLGAIFVPLDPEHPPERIEYFLNDSGSRFLITADEFSTLAQKSEKTTITVESLSAARIFSVPKVTHSLNDPACIIYTSGSTGLPKGVSRLHRGIVSRLAYTHYESNSLFCHYMSLCYGFSQERIMLPLMLGMPLAILPDQCQKAPERFAQEIQNFQITHITVVPAVLQQLIDPQQRLSDYMNSVRSVTVARAFLSLEMIRGFKNVFPHVKLINIYGSTECGTLTRGEMNSGHEANVGQPAPNMEVFILDDQLEPVPPGEIGELFGGGPSLAGGYWRQPELTSARFVANPFRTEASLLYRTGDRGRWLADGTVQLAGRADRQVKVRGYRVELAEVEDALLRLDGLYEVAVIHQQLGYDNRLISYICPRQPNVLTVNRLRKHLLGWLPTHMLPSAFVFLDRLPRTPIGKLDYKSLPAPGAGRPVLETPYVPPQTSLEDEVACIWAEVLNKDCVGRNDHFLDLGGDSILAIEVCAAMEERLGIQLDSVSVFEHPTVAEIARIVLLIDKAAL